jgi:polyisoprenoid-binding protein YceI
VFVKRCASLAIAIALTVGFAGSVRSADTYEVDGAHAYVGFTISHLVINRVRGTFNDFTGTIVYDADDITISSFSGAINAASIDTAHQKRDSDLRGESFFDVDKYPQITFESNRVEQGEDSAVLHGVLTMHGVSKEVAIPFRINGIAEFAGKVRLGFEARLELNRHDYGISYSRLMDNGGLVVGNEVFIELQGEAIKVTDN